MKPLKYHDLKALRKMERCLVRLIEKNEEPNESLLFVDGLKQLLENTRELKLFFQLILDPELEVYAADWTPVSRPLIEWAVRGFHE